MRLGPRRLRLRPGILRPAPRKASFWESFVKRPYALLAVSVCASILLLACHPPTAAPREANDPKAAAASAGTRDATVELSAAQLQALRIEPIGVQRFPMQFEALGSVNFEEDPAIVQAESTLLTAQASLDASHRELVRVQGLGEINGIAPKEVEGARAADLSAAAAVKAAREAVRALGISDQEMDSLLRTGRFTAAASPGTRTWVLINVPESESSKVRAGEPIRVSVPAFSDQTFPGHVARVYATLDPATHRLALRGLVEDPHQQLRPGMLADVAIEYGAPVTGVAIPTTGVVREPDGTMIAWVTSDRAHFFSRRLGLGQQDDGHYQVLAGLKSGDLVVTQGGVFLSNLLEAPPSD